MCKRENRFSRRVEPILPALLKNIPANWPVKSVQRTQFNKRLIPAKAGFNLVEAYAAVRRERAEQLKLRPFDWSEWKAFPDEGARHELVGSSATCEQITTCSASLLGHKHFLIGITRVRNEALVLRDTLDHLGKHVDAIVAYDDASTDQTLEILSGHPKVALVIANRLSEADIEARRCRGSAPTDSARTSELRLDILLRCG